MDSLVVWSGVMIACIVVEILTVSLVSVWFVIGAFAALIALLIKCISSNTGRYISSSICYMRNSSTPYGCKKSERQHNTYE